MRFAWRESQDAFRDAADCFVHHTALVQDRWSHPALGEWDVRALVGHTSRALTTVETYLAKPAPSTDVDSAGAYFRASSGASIGAGVAQRGRDAGAALGADPTRFVEDLAGRVLKRVDNCDGTEIVTTFAGGMRLSDYLPTRTFELTVHTADLASALGSSADLPATSATQALALVSELAVTGGLAGDLLLMATGRGGPPAGLSVL